MEDVNLYLICGILSLYLLGMYGYDMNDRFHRNWIGNLLWPFVIAMFPFLQVLYWIRLCIEWVQHRRDTYYTDGWR